MKRFILFSLCSIFFMQQMLGQMASSQTTSNNTTNYVTNGDEKIQFGVRGGLNFMSVGGDDTEGLDSKLGFHAGIVMDIPTIQNLYIQPGLYLLNKGYKYGEDDYSTKITMAFAQLPILASYRLELNNDIKLHINAGPYLALGLFGNIKQKYEGDSEDFDPFDDEEGGFKRFDAGLSFGAGVTFSDVYLGINYDLGLTKIAEDFDAKYRNFYITVGYSF